MDQKISFEDKIFIHQNHPWMEKSYPCIKVSLMESLYVMILGENWKKAVTPRATCNKTLYST